MIPEINTRLIAVRGKLRRSIVLNTNVIYEVCAILVPIILVRLSILDIVFLERAMACRKIPDYLKSTAVGFPHIFHYAYSNKFSDNLPMDSRISFP